MFSSIPSLRSVTLLGRPTASPPIPSPSTSCPPLRFMPKLAQPYRHLMFPATIWRLILRHKSSSEWNGLGTPRYGTNSSSSICLPAGRLFLRTYKLLAYSKRRWSCSWKPLAPVVSCPCSADLERTQWPFQKQRDMCAANKESEALEGLCEELGDREIPLYRLILEFDELQEQRNIYRDENTKVERFLRAVV